MAAMRRSSAHPRVLSTHQDERDWTLLILSDLLCCRRQHKAGLEIVSLILNPFRWRFIPLAVPAPTTLAMRGSDLQASCVS